jgi:hypothetical protein
VAELDFPSNPALNQIYNDWIWTGELWEYAAGSGLENTLLLQSGQVSVEFTNGIGASPGVVYPKAYAAAPDVVATISGSRAGYVSGYQGTAFQVDFLAAQTDGNITGTRTVHWIAVGPPANQRDANFGGSGIVSPTAGGVFDYATPITATTGIGTSDVELLESRKTVTGLVVGQEYLIRQNTHVRFGTGDTATVTVNTWVEGLIVDEVVETINYNIWISNERFNSTGYGTFIADSETVDVYTTARTSAGTFQTIVGPSYTLWTIEPVIPEPPGAAQLGPGPWIDLAVENDWLAGTQGGPQYRVNGDMVELRGSLQDGTSGLVAFTMPANVTPPQEYRFAVAGTTSGPVTAILNIGTGGGVVPRATDTGFIGLNPVMYSLTP